MKPRTTLKLSKALSWTVIAGAATCYVAYLRSRLEKIQNDQDKAVQSAREAKKRAELDEEYRYVDWKFDHLTRDFDLEEE
jgi:hypothetical protein